MQGIRFRLIVAQSTYHAGITVEATSDLSCLMPHHSRATYGELRLRLRPRVLRRLVFSEYFRL